MPIYEYRCGGCGRKVSVFFRSFGSVGDASCPRCGSTDLTRLFSRVAVHRSSASDGDDFADGGDDEFGGMFDGLDEEDPRAMARALRRMSEETGEPIEPEMEEALGRMEAGEDPEAVMAGLDEAGDVVGGAGDDADDEF